MINIPNFPEKEELLYKEKSFLLSVYEQFQSGMGPKIWLLVLLAVLLLAIPGRRWLERSFLNSFLASLQPPVVNLNPYHPRDIKIFQVKLLEVVPQEYSLAAQLVNPNAEISARSITYKFILKDRSAAIVKEVPGETYLLANESEGVSKQQVTLAAEPADRELEREAVRWTKQVPAFAVSLETLQKGSGVTAEGKFFVEGLIRNSQSLRIKEVEVTILVFDSSNTELLAVNSTVLDDLKALESRYFRVIWPKVFAKFGEIQVIPAVDSLNPGLVLEEPLTIPAR